MNDMRKDVSLNLVGQSDAELWGLPLAEWQRRAWAKLGAKSGGATAGARLLVGIDWILSPGLQASLLEIPGAALVTHANGVPVLAALHCAGGVTEPAMEAMVGRANPDIARLEAAGFRVGDVGDFAGQYNKALRKREAPYAMSLRQYSVTDVERRLFKGSYKGVTDFVTKYAWPVPAFHVTRWAARRKITPNTITTLSLVMVVVAFIFFWHGCWIPGILSAWLMTFLDTVDGKLARTTMTYSKWGNVYDHGIDLIHPPFWYWAIWHGLGTQDVGPTPDILWISLVVILVGYVLNRIEEGIFMHTFGFHIHVWQPIDSFMREITARRNPNMFIFMLSVFVCAPGWGFALVALWTLGCLIFHGARLLQAFNSSGPVRSWMEG